MSPLAFGATGPLSHNSNLRCRDLQRQLNVGTGRRRGTRLLGVYPGRCEAPEGSLPPTHFKFQRRGEFSLLSGEGLQNESNFRFLGDMARPRR